MKNRDLKDVFSARDGKRKHWSGRDKPDTIEMAGKPEEERLGRQILMSARSQGGRPTVRWEINPI